MISKKLKLLIAVAFLTIFLMAIHISAQEVSMNIYNLGVKITESTVRFSAENVLMIAQNRDEKCIQGCKDTHRDEVKLCNTLYPPKYRTEEHRQCLANARAKFDACLATCS